MKPAVDMTAGQIERLCDNMLESNSLGEGEESKKDFARIKELSLKIQGKKQK